MSSLSWALPVIIMMLFSIISIFITLFARIHALRKGNISVDDFKTMDFCKKDNPWLEVSSRHLNNLFQTPVLFYFSFLIIMLDQALSSVAYLLVLGWIFVAFKIINSIIHLTFNNLALRLMSFLIANAALFTLIVMLLIEIVKH
ncbi:MAPEG family protein [Fangia hongkongensis]|uniref:MAPEG family protein n=2 Tax=Fangia hongkongensis TaxID=270495 RepID=UPI0003829AD9|nr:MAPEG family protein [Fangia hongkongensis]